MYLTGFDFIKKHLCGQRILDVGNIGKAGSQYKKIIESFPDCEIMGLDNDAEKAEELKLPHQLIGDANKMPFPDNYFDGVILAEVLEHTSEPLRMIREVYRVLNRGGVLILTTPNPYALSRMLSFLFRRMDTLGNPDHKIFYTPAVLKNMLENSGFRVDIISTPNAIHIKSRIIYSSRFRIFKMLGENICIKAIKQ